MRIVIAVGGNAIAEGGPLNKLSALVVVLSRRGNEIVITHGNGPQVGELALLEHKTLAQLTKETQAELGEKISRSLIAQGGARDRVKVVLTHVVVDKKDREFSDPSKPIGKFFKHDEAKSLSRKGFVVKHLLEGYRRVVPSPKPKKIIELGEIESALKGGSIVIAAGGGGIAVAKAKGKPEYLNAVIDKDRASSLLAVRLKADVLCILTDVDGAFLNFETKHQRLLRKITAEHLQILARSGCFEAGSMLPKVQACIDFVNATGNRAIIGNLSKASSVFKSKGATVVVP
jgi:carbamate kinase